MTVVDYERRCAGPSDIYAHLPYLYEQGHGKQIVELGVRYGNSTAAFLAAIDDAGTGHLWSVDTQKPGVPADWFELPQWTFIEGDDLKVATRIPSTFDVLFVDTSHLYEQTVAELQLYGPRVKSGGRILLHDTELEWPEDDPHHKGPRFPVRQAVETVCAQFGWAWTNRDGCYGLATIIPRRSQ